VLLSDLLLAGVYPAVPWAAYLLTGLAVGQLALDRTSTAVRLAAAGAALWAAARRPARCCSARSGGYAALGELVGTTTPSVVAERSGHSFFGNVPTDSWWLLASTARTAARPPDPSARRHGAARPLGPVCWSRGDRVVLLAPPAAVRQHAAVRCYSRAHLYVLH
jgi:hypothetical protein